MTERDIYIVIREMVREKYVELERAMFKIDYSSIIHSVRQQEIKKFISDQFIVPALKKKLPPNTGWVDAISSENLFRLYTYLNYVLGCLYYYMPVTKIDIVDEKTQKVIDYRLRRCYGFEYQSGDDIYNSFKRNLIHNKNMGTDRNIIWIEKISRFMDLYSKPTGPVTKDLDVKDKTVREEAVGHLIVSCLKEVEEKLGKTYTFEEVKSKLKLNTYFENDRSILGVDKAFLREPKDSLISRIVEDYVASSVVVGLDELGHPVTKVGYDLIDCYGNTLPDDTFISNID